MSTETKPVKLVAGTFFQELRSMGYSPNQMIGIANELLDLVAGEIRERKNARETLAAEAVELRRAS
ncbi:MAG TPA: hypothetical protein VK447_14335 [Myxococcaceae bacterium]|nr:hypothetical protein [Myxococcaceae bacterium]